MGLATDVGTLRVLTEASAADHPTVRMAAFTGLGHVGERGVAALVKALRHQDPRTREHAAASLRNLGVRAGEGVPALVIATREIDPGIATAAVQALGTAGSAAPLIAVPALIDSLENPRQYRYAVHSLAQIGKPAQAAIHTLQLAQEKLGWDTPEGKETARCLGRLESHRS